MRCIFDSPEKPCTGRGQMHHLVERQRLKQEITSPYALADALYDPRNLVAVCGFHHQRITGHQLYVPQDKLPEGFDAFLDEHGVRGWWENRLARAA